MVFKLDDNYFLRDSNIVLQQGPGCKNSALLLPGQLVKMTGFMIPVYPGLRYELNLLYVILSGRGSQYLGCLRAFWTFRNFKLYRFTFV